MNDPNSSPVILSVAALTEKLRKNLEKEFPFVWVRGEVTNLSQPGSGHIYFALKDREAQLQCVWFRQYHGGSNASSTFDPLTGEVFDNPVPSLASSMCNGLEILCAGRIGIYANRGKYQLVVEMAQAYGAGQLALEFEAKKKKLAAKGYFNIERKRKIPVNPQRVALITSPHGAALHDFLELAQSRGGPSRIVLFPVPVQGEGAAAQIAQAIQQANTLGWAQVIVVIRGGGSPEDLQAFNEEELADAVFNSRLPILAGIGHEIDLSLVDLVADLRAATPSHAAQLLWTSRLELWQRLDDADKLLQAIFEKKLTALRSNYLFLADRLNFCSPEHKINLKTEKYENLNAEFFRSIFNYLDSKHSLCSNYRYKLENYKNNIDFSSLYDNVLSLTNQLIFITSSHILNSLQHLDYLSSKLNLFLDNIILDKLCIIDKLSNSLASYNSIAVIQKGYGLIILDGKIINSINELKINDNISIKMADGEFTTTIRTINHL